MDSTQLHRFMAKFHREGECWVWHGARSDTGYGNFGVKGVATAAHRLSYEHFTGPIPPGLHIDHLCRNRPCINPAHLEAVTQRVNNLRGESLQAKNARKTHCVHGHEFTPENTIARALGRRGCMACRDIANRAASNGPGLGKGGRKKAQTHCKNGHEFTEENTIRKGPDGRNRNCRACSTKSKRLYAQRQMAQESVSRP